jgi:hypothetical protein
MAPVDRQAQTSTDAETLPAIYFDLLIFVSLRLVPHAILGAALSVEDKSMWQIATAWW